MQTSEGQSGGGREGGREGGRSAQEHTVSALLSAILPDTLELRTTSQLPHCGRKPILIVEALDNVAHHWAYRIVRLSTPCVLFCTLSSVAHHRACRSGCSDIVGLASLFTVSTVVCLRPGRAGESLVQRRLLNHARERREALWLSQACFASTVALLNTRMPHYCCGLIPRLGWLVLPPEAILSERLSSHVGR